MESATVFNIERFATEDGKGIRTVVFLKGCALRCKWCANPESQSFDKEILVKTNVCVRCGKCVRLCPREAIRLTEPYGYISDNRLCDGCGICVEQCYADARQLMGARYDPPELMDVLIKDRDYYLMSGGGVTFSGGEPFYHSGFIRETAGLLRAEGINVLVETCGFVPPEYIRETSGALAYIFFDIKHMSPEKHRLYTSQDNALILSNLEWLCQNYQGELWIRYPVISGCNDSVSDLREFFAYVKTLPGSHHLVFLPYHRLGLPKYTGLGRGYPMGDMVSLKRSQLEYVLRLGQKFGVKATIG